MVLMFWKRLKIVLTIIKSQMNFIPVLDLKRLNIIKATTGLLLFILGLFLGMNGGVNVAYATSGACSSHGGVSCSAGADWDGSVICSDGWTGSSVSYADMVSCGDSSTSDYVDYYTLYYDLTEAACEDSTYDWSASYSDLYSSCTDYYYYSGVDSYFFDCLDEYDSSSGEPYANWLDYCSDSQPAEYSACLLDASNSIALQCANELVEQPSDVSTEFSDVSTTDPYYQAIHTLYELGIVAGYGDGTYKPDEEINRAEFLKILIGWTDTSAFDDLSWDCFTDVFSSDWYSKYVFIAKSLGVVQGYPDGSFGPEKTINVSEALKMTFGFLQFDVPDVTGEWYQKYVDYAKAHSWYLDDWTSPDQELTRGEMAELFYRVIAGS